MTFFTKYLHKFKGNDQGAVSLEIIVLMPLLILWLIGSNSFFDAFKTNLRASKASYTAIDLVSRQATVGPDYMRNIASIFESIVDADGTASTIVVSSIHKVGDDLEVDWSVNGEGAAGLTSAGQIPTALMPNLVDNEYVILLQSSVPYVPLYAWAHLQASTYTNTIVVTPRFDPRVSYDPNG